MRRNGRGQEILPMPWQRIRVESLVAPAKVARMTDIASFPTGQGSGGIVDIRAAADLSPGLVEETEEAPCR